MRNDDRVRILHMIEATESVEQLAAEETGLFESPS
jgi:hypothetical protein